ncbi:MAG: exo-alpha-sialidase [Pirellulales bacterium]|nr:exo-alpha-sialidase [Pirellulales bacterium]
MLYTLLITTACVAGTPEWKETEFSGKKLLLDPRCRPLSTSLLGPFVTLGDGSVLAVDDERTMLSEDGGNTWSPRPLFRQPDKFRCRGERALLRTRDGALILAFLNSPEQVLRWDQAQGGPLPECRLPVYIVRSPDDGRTWEEPQKIQDGYCGALRTMIQLRSGRIVLGSQVAVANPGRHVSFTCVSDDEGKTWKKSNVIDLGDYGGYGDHGGGIEPTLAQLKDGRLWMLIRTYRGCFTEAFSTDEGLTWTDIRPSKIEASGSPGQLRRLQSGRLALFWNRYIDPQKKTGRREQLSIAFSEDDGATWSEPAVVAYDPMQPGDTEPQHRLSYPYVCERVPGELWVSTMQGPARIKLYEDDFFPRRLSEKTYPARYLPDAGIRIDGRADEAAWSKAAVEKGFAFPWKDAPAPPTEFRALCDGENFYFTFRIEDADIFVLDTLRDEEDAVFEDRGEMYFSRDDKMTDYYCIEVDSKGRAFDYRGAYYRKLDPSCNMAGIETAASPLEQGYVVEGRLPLAGFEALGFPRLKPGVKIRCGLYRAEFSHDRSGKPVLQRESIHNRGRQLEGPPPIEAWMSWIDPKTEEPDFHVPTSLGWLEVVE